MRKHHNLIVLQPVLLNNEWYLFSLVELYQEGLQKDCLEFLFFISEKEDMKLLLLLSTSQLHANIVWHIISRRPEICFGSVFMLKCGPNLTFWLERDLWKAAGGLACALLGTVAGQAPVPLKNTRPVRTHVPVYTEKCQERRGQAFKTFPERSWNTDWKKMILKNMKGECPQRCPAASCALLMSFIFWKHACFSSWHGLSVVWSCIEVPN